MAGATEASPCCNGVGYKRGGMDVLKVLVTILRKKNFTSVKELLASGSWGGISLAGDVSENSVKLSGLCYRVRILAS